MPNGVFYLNMFANLKEFFNNKIKPRLFLTRMFPDSETKVSPALFFYEKNYLGVYLAVILMIAVNAFWMIVNILNNDSRGLFNPIPLSGYIVHFIACICFLFSPAIYVKSTKKDGTKNDDILRIAIFFVYMATVYFIFSVNVGKDILLANNGISDENIGIQISSLYIIILAMFPAYSLVDTTIIFITDAVLTIIPKYIAGGGSYNLSSNFVLIFSAFVAYLYFRKTLLNNYKLTAQILDKKKEEEIKHLAIINALSDEFSEIMYVDLGTNKVKIIRTAQGDDFTNKEMPGTFNDNVATFILQNISDSDREKVKNSILTYNISKRFLKEDAYFEQFQIKGKKDSFFELKVVKDKTSDNNAAILGLRDITGQLRESKAQQEELMKAKDAAENASKAKSLFLFNMSHDIRTPMNAVTGYIELAKKYKDNPDRLMDCLNKMSISADHLLHLINDVLDMARIESGKVTVDLNPVDLAKCAVDLQAMIETSAKQKDLEFETKVDIKHQYVYIDLLRANQVVLNIISNSIKYTKPGGKIFASIVETPSDKEGCAHYDVVVQDTGIGMSKEYVEHIFEAFSRAQDATHSGVQGTGLGMSIVKSIIDLMHGTINVESELGVGTKTTVSLDLTLADPVVETLEDNDENISLDGMKVLLVEDNELNREIAKEILGEFNINVSEANDGDIAVDIIKKAHKGDFDLVLMDIQMPMMNGYQATEAIRQLDCELKDIPIVAMTANAFEEDKNNALKAGMNGHLAKPIDISALKKVLTKYFKK